MSELQPLPFNEDMEDFLLDEMAHQSHNLIAIQEKFNRFFKVEMSGEAFMRFRREKKEAINQRRSELYNQTDSIPVSHAFIRQSIAESRIEWLTQNEIVLRTVRKINDKGNEYYEEVKSINDPELRKWCEFAREEEYLAKKLMLEIIVKEVEDKKAKEKLLSSGFKPVAIDTGF